MPKKRADYSKAAHLWTQATDKEIALFLGVTSSTVTSHRNKHGIPSFCKKVHRKIPEDLGVTPDLEIAEREHVTLDVVRSWRHNRGIPAPEQNAPDVVAARKKARDAIQTHLADEKGYYGSAAGRAGENLRVRVTAEQYRQLVAMADSRTGGETRVSIRDAARYALTVGLEVLRKRERRARHHPEKERKERT